MLTKKKVQPPFMSKARTSTPTANAVSESKPVAPPARDTPNWYCPAGSRPTSCSAHGSLTKGALDRQEGYILHSQFWRCM